MRLTRYTDYALRVLLHLASNPGRLCSIGEIARAYGVSQSHLMKVVNDLVAAGFLESVRGRFGGVRLARPPQDINVGVVVRHTEGSFDLVDCGSCVVAPVCGLTGALKRATAAFIDTLDGYVLSDLIPDPQRMAALLKVNEGVAIPA